jgi:hypothetical protein
VEVIAAADNMAQGSMYGQFVQSWACNLQTGANPPTQRTANAGGGTALHRIACPGPVDSADRLHLHVVNEADAAAPLPRPSSLTGWSVHWSISGPWWSIISVRG